MNPTTSAAHPQIIPPAVTLSDSAEHRIVFWSAPDKSFHSPEVVSAVTGLSTNTLQNMRNKEDGPTHIKRGGKIYYRKADVIKWMENGQTLRPVEVHDPRNAA